MPARPRWPAAAAELRPGTRATRVRGGGLGAGARLRVGVEPSPSRAPHLPSAPCQVVERSGMVDVCAFGAPADRALATVALVGDSHAAHWRAALDVVAKEKRWRALTIMRGGCPLSTAVRALPEPARRMACAEWKRQVF